MSEKAQLALVGLQECLELLGSRAEGLSREEARLRHESGGPNCLPAVSGPPLAQRFLVQFTHRMALLLWTGAILAAATHLPELAIAIALVNLINGCFSFWQEFRAQKATQALRKLLPRWARVRRQGQEERIPAEELVVGDILLLGEGEHISADCRLLWSVDFLVDSSVLTGESRPVLRSAQSNGDTQLAWMEQPNLVFAGSSVSCGTARAVVFAIGENSEFGRIAHLTQNLPETPSPLQIELERLTRTVSYLVVGVGLLFFALGVGLAHLSPTQGFVLALGMIVAFVPEGLPPTVTLSLAMGVQRMARRNALVKRLSAVETLGCTNVICTDKTGTLTQNQMTVREVVTLRERIRVEGSGYAPRGQFLGPQGPVELQSIQELVRAVSLCNDARLLAPEGDLRPDWSILGDPTEGALQTLAAKAGLDPEGLRRDYPRQGEIPFESARKRMLTLHQGPDQNYVVYAKGAPREMLEVCTGLGEEDLAGILSAQDELARGGLRVLGVACAHLTQAPPGCAPEDLERDLTWLGLVAMHDPPRPEVEAAVRLCHQSGVRVLMITGDYGLTGESVARKIGIVSSPNCRILTGLELERLSDSELESILSCERELIFARMAPEQKLQIVQALQRQGQVVAVTGDGVNDAPALRQADIGVAMGRSGSDVAREASAMVLTDDSFASIVAAIEEGRAVYANLQRFVSYIFTSNMAEAFPFAFFALSQGRIPLALTIMQVLAIDLGTDMLPALALGVEPPEEGLMQCPPRDRRRPLVTAGLLARACGLLGSVAGFGLMLSFFLAFQDSNHHWLDLTDQGQTYRRGCSMALATVVMCQVGNVLAHRTEVNSIWTRGLGGNPFLWVAVTGELVFLLTLIYVPWLQPIFGTAPLEGKDWGWVLLWTPALLVVDEIRKLWLRMRRKS